MPGAEAVVKMMVSTRADGVPETGSSRGVVHICEVDEIAGFGSAKDGKYLVHREFGRVQQGQPVLNLERKEASISCQVHLANVGASFNCQTHEAGPFPHSSDPEAGCFECLLSCR
jgi:hypothetical protein